MIRSLLVPDYQLHHILVVFGMLAWISLMCLDCSDGATSYSNSMIALALPWGAFTVWSQLTTHDGWKVITDEDKITKRIIRLNGTHLFMSGDSPFARGPLADAIGKDGEGEEVEKLLQGTFTMDKEGIDDILRR
mmetsp:Transcript_20521/g.24444  ORF Transcript_20521/g.24444 Transcript_20521/m.24444 type:complete len:134 (+) Transcript_20521:2-403(+)